MKCPACSNEMIEKDFGGVLIDVCNGCHGLWFDWMEIVKLDESHEGMGKALEDALNDPRTNDENRKQLSCPKCNTRMQKHLFKNDKEVNVDECYKCGCFFLDSGELNHIRTHRLSEEERKEYAHRLMEVTNGIEQMEKNFKDSRQRTKAITTITKYISPSWYLKD